jgi:hypothetical protein
MKLSPRKDAGVSRGELLAHVNFLARKLFHEIVKEYQRLNSARLGKDELSRLASRDRVHAVKVALAEHHKGSARCC